MTVRDMQATTYVTGNDPSRGSFQSLTDAIVNLLKATGASGEMIAHVQDMAAKATKFDHQRAATNARVKRFRGKSNVTKQTRNVTKRPCNVTNQCNVTQLYPSEKPQYFCNVTGSSSLSKKEDSESVEIQNPKTTSVEEPCNVSGRYAFEAGPIRLTRRDYEQWRAAFPNLHLDAELIALQGWAAQQTNWFIAVASCLAKRNREYDRRSPAPPQKRKGIIR